MDPFSDRAPALKQGTCHCRRRKKDAIFGHRRRAGKGGLSSFLHTIRGTAVLWRGHTATGVRSEARAEGDQSAGEGWFVAVERWCQAEEKEAAAEGDQGEGRPLPDPQGWATRERRLAPRLWDGERDAPALS